jgi:hypothetical protein
MYTIRFNVKDLCGLCSYVSNGSENKTILCTASGDLCLQWRFSVV